MYTVLCFNKENPNGTIVFGYDQDPFLTNSLDAAKSFRSELNTMFKPVDLTVNYEVAQLTVVK